MLNTNTGRNKEAFLMRDIARLPACRWDAPEVNVGPRQQPALRNWEGRSRLKQPLRRGGRCRICQQRIAGMEGLVRCYSCSLGGSGSTGPEHSRMVLVNDGGCAPTAVEREQEREIRAG